MNLLKRVEELEAKLFPKKSEGSYKVVLLQKGETKDQGNLRTGTIITPGDHIIYVSFVSPGDPTSD